MGIVNHRINNIKKRGLVLSKKLLLIGCIIAALVIAIMVAPNIDTIRLAGMVNGTKTQEEIDNTTVFCTKTGNCYHVSGCSYLRSSCYEITLREAQAKGLEPCSRCNAYRWVYY